MYLYHEFCGGTTQRRLQFRVVRLVAVIQDYLCVSAALKVGYAVHQKSLRNIVQARVARHVYIPIRLFQLLECGHVEIIVSEHRDVGSAVGNEMYLVFRIFCETAPLG